MWSPSRSMRGAAGRVPTWSGVVPTWKVASAFERSSDCRFGFCATEKKTETLPRSSVTTTGTPPLVTREGSPTTRSIAPSSFRSPAVACSVPSKNTPAPSDAAPSRPTRSSGD